MSREQYTDEGSLRNYRIEIPNILDDMDLDPYTFRLYAHIKRRAGDSGLCKEYTREIAAHCKMSPGQVSKSKTILVEKGLIEIAEVDTPNGKGHHITVVDIWLENMTKYRAMKEQRKAQSVHTVNSTVHTVNASVHTVNEPVHTVNNKKEPVKERTIEEVDSRKKPRSPDHLSDDQFFQSLKTNPAYTGIDVDRVYGKLVAWCDANNKRPTRKRLVNWLNSEDVPLTKRSVPLRAVPSTPPVITGSQIDDLMRRQSA